MLRKLMFFLGGIAAAGALAAAVAWAWYPQTTSAAELDQAIAEVSAAPQAPQGGGKGQAAAKAVVAGLIGQTAQSTGLSRQDVLAELKAGKTLAEVASAHGSSADAVEQAFAAKAKDRLDRQVKNGRISQPRADDLLARLKTKAAELMQDATLGGQIAARQEKAADRKVMPELVRAAAEVTGLPAGDISGRLRDGESLTKIVTSAGKDISAVIDKATADFRATAENAVK